MLKHTSSLENAVISDSDLILYSICPYSYYLYRLEGKTKIPTTANAAQALFFSNKRKGLFEVRDKNIGILFEGQRRAGPNLKYIEDMGREELEEYMPFVSAEAFGGSLKGGWLLIAKRNIFHENYVYWDYNNQHWAIAANLKNAGINYYNFILEHSVPIMGLVDKERTFKFEGQFFKVKIPEIRVVNCFEGQQIFLDDPSIFDFKGEAIQGARTDINNSAIITLKLYGLSRLIKKYPVTYLPKLRIPVRLWDSIEHEDKLILQNLVFRHINFITDEEATTKRTDTDLDKLRELIKLYNRGIAAEQFDPNPAACPSCRYNILGINGKPVCEYKSNRTSPSVPRYYFDKENFRIEEKQEGNEIYIIGVVDKHNALLPSHGLENLIASHEVGRLRLTITEKDTNLEVLSRYV